MKRIAKYFDKEGMHILVFNEDGTKFEHHVKPANKVTNADLATVNRS